VNGVNGATGAGDETKRVSSVVANKIIKRRSRARPRATHYSNAYRVTTPS